MHRVKNGSTAPREISPLGFSRRNPSLPEYRHPTSSANTSVRRLDYPSSSEMQISASEKTCEASAIKDRILSLERAPCPSLWVRSRQGRLPSERPPEIAKCLLAVERCRVAGYRSGGGRGGGGEEREVLRPEKQVKRCKPIFRVCFVYVPCKSRSFRSRARDIKRSRSRQRRIIHGAKTRPLRDDPINHKEETNSGGKCNQTKCMAFSCMEKPERWRRQAGR